MFYFINSTNGTPIVLMVLPFQSTVIGHNTPVPRLCIAVNEHCKDFIVTFGIKYSKFRTLLFENILN